MAENPGITSDTLYLSLVIYFLCGPPHQRSHLPSQAASAAIILSHPHSQDANPRSQTLAAMLKAQGSCGSPTGIVSPKT